MYFRIILCFDRFISDGVATNQRADIVERIKREKHELENSELSFGQVLGTVGANLLPDVEECEDDYKCHFTFSKYGRSCFTFCSSVSVSTFHSEYLYLSLLIE